MNLNPLFIKQKQLDEHIVNEKGLHGQDLLKKKTVALICELYECVNEARFFKFWSEDQKPSREEYIGCDLCMSEQPGCYEVMYNNEILSFPCPKCEGNEEVYVGDELLEEYADLIHFTLSIANDLGYTEHKYIHTEGTDLNDLVLGITNIATIIPQSRETHHISTLINNVIQLGYQLGFTEDDVLNAYEDKNKENHRRQETNY